MSEAMAAVRRQHTSTYSPTILRLASARRATRLLPGDSRRDQPCFGRELDRDLGSRPHPRLYGTFLRVFGRYVRERGVPSLVDAVRRRTSLVATTFGLGERGSIEVGMFADFVVFDAKTTAGNVTYTYPVKSGSGIDHVIVKGQIGWQSGCSTQARAGVAIRRQGAAKTESR